VVYLMMFHTVKNAIVQLLGDNAQSRFQVIGYQRQGKGASETLGINQFVQVYYSGGSFPKSAGRRTGTKTHDIKMNINLTTSAKAQGDLSVLDDPGATIQAKAAALLAVREAAEIADNQMDALIKAVFQILLDARNDGIGLGVGEVSSRWIDAIQKDTMIDRGDLIVKTANFEYSCRVQEDVFGDIGVTPDPMTIDAALNVPNTGAGILVEN